MQARPVALLVLLFVVSVALLLVAPPRAARAQTAGSLAVTGGSSTDARGFRSSALTLAPGALILAGARSSVWAGASGTLFGNNSWSAGANSALAARTASVGGVALTLNANGGAAVTSYHATFATADAVPAVELAWRSLSIYGGAHAAVGMTAIPTQGGFGPFPLAPALQSQTRTSVAPVYGAQVRHISSPASGIAAWVRVDPMRIAGVSVNERSAGLAVTHNGVTLSGSAGVRRADDERASFSTGSASVALSPAISLDVSGGRFPSNRFTGAAAGSYLSAGVTMHFGASAGRSLPRPAGVGRTADGTTRLSILARDASSVEIAGDWNDWQPAATERAANGVWYADVRLGPGEYRYSFRIDGREWRVPSGAVAVDDGFGGKSAYVVVREAGAAR